MRNIKPWQAIVLAVIAVAIAVVVIYKSSVGGGEKGAPIPPVFTGGPPPVQAGR